MTVTVTTSRASYATNGVTTAFPIPFYFLSNSDIVALFTNAAGAVSALVLTTDYTLVGAGVPAGGTLTTTGVLANGGTLTLYRDPAVTQALALVENDPLPTQPVQQALDKLTMLVQRVRDLISRALVLNDADTSASLMLPLSSSRANKLLGFDGSGNLIAAAGASDTSVAQVRLDLANPTLGLGADLVGVSGVTPNSVGAFLRGLGASLQSQTNTAFLTAGSPTAYTFTPVPALTALVPNRRYRMQLHTPNGANPTLAISGLAPVPFKVYNANGAKVAPVVGSLPTLSDIEYDGADIVVYDQLPPVISQIRTITATVAANALTLGLSPTTLDFRSSVLSDGTVNTRSVAPAISLVVPSTATLGTLNNTAARLVLLAIDNAGTVELAVVNLAGGNNLDETTLISTTAISAAATANNVVYSATARVNVPFRVVGFVDITEAVAGTWATAPTTIQGVGGQVFSAQDSIGYGQTWQNVTGSRASGTTYYNTTGKPIALSVFGTLASANGVSLVINGVQVGYSYASASNISPLVFGVVPPGGSYSVTSTPSSIAQWNELR